MIFGKSIITYKLPKELPYLDIKDIFISPLLEKTLNIFEKKYIEAVNKALADPSRMVAILPFKDSNIGCAARITSFIEEGDLCFINIKGIRRFTVSDIKKSRKGFYKIEPNWDCFLADMQLEKQKIKNRISFEDIIIRLFRQFF